jgi:Tfp pilus assembly protein PilF
LEDYSKAILLNPGISTVYFNRALVYLGLKQYSRAIDDFTVFLEHNPGDAQALYHRATVYETAGDTEKAFRDYRSAAQLGSRKAQTVMELKGLSW